MNYKARQKFLTSRKASKQLGWNLFLGLCCAAMVATMLLMAGCATENRTNFPPSWLSVKPGMQRDQVIAALGAPAQTSPGGAEEIYLKAMQNNHWELHVQYDAGGTVAQKWYFYR